MREIFNLDGGVMKFLTVLSDICFISILWILCCIPVITIGASTTAAYYTMIKVVRKETGVLHREFFKAFQTNFKDAVILNIIYLMVGAILVVNTYMMYVSLNQATSDIYFYLMFLYFVLFLLLLGVMIYTYPSLSRFVMGRYQLIRFAIFSVFRHFPSTLLLIVLFVLTLLIMGLFPIGVIFMPGVCLYAYTYIMERILRKYMSKEMLELWDGESESITE